MSGGPFINSTNLSTNSKWEECMFYMILACYDNRFIREEKLHICLEKCAWKTEIFSWSNSV